MELRPAIRRLLCRLVGHRWRWQWRFGSYEYHYCARCGARYDVRER